MKDVGSLHTFDIFNDHVVYFMAIWYMLSPFGKFSGYLVYYTPFWYLIEIQIWQS
jgi:hypothetical protein